MILAYHSEKTHFKPIYTDTNMCDPHLRQRIEEALEEIDRLRVHSALPTDGWELALELGVDPDTEEAICSYYFAFHPTRCLFWLHDFDLRGALDDLRGVTEQTHIREFPCDNQSSPMLTERVARSGITSSILVRDSNDDGCSLGTDNF